MRKENDDHNAVFACQVVSGKHAKLALSDSGQIYVVDLKSRHGTHLLKQGELVSKMLQPEVETPLSDGDVLTFGKTVGSGVFLVAPITVRVELLRETDEKTIHLPSPPTYTPPLSPSSPARCRKTSSGRYGVFPPTYHNTSDSSSSSPSGSYSSSGPSRSEPDSDIEEISPWMTVLRHYDPLQGINNLPSIFHEPFTKLSKPPYVSGSSGTNLSAISPSENPIAENFADDSAIADKSTNPTNLSRSHSPMELSTPSPAPSDCESDAIEQHADYGSTYSQDQPDGPVVPIPGLQAAHVDLDLYENSVKEHIETIEDLRSPPQSMIESVAGLMPQESVREQHISDITPPSMSMPNIDDEIRMVELRQSVDAFEHRLGDLRRNVDNLTGEFRETEDDVIDMQAQIQRLEKSLEFDSRWSIKRLDAAERRLSALADLQGQVNTLQTQMDAPEKEGNARPIVDIRTCANALDGLVAELKSLREDTETRLAARVEDIKIARAEALLSISSQVEAFKSLKRKREGEIIEQPSPTPTIIELPRPTFPPPTCQLPITILEPEQVRPRKRMRKVFRTITHTATAVAVGAVATWTALAFA
ncbi:hypothetical protein BJ138DRAFT_1149167 [Hygrophoropsis aurantiaca]|uniref:Uncharacterized protein n=1 Tax=Hygrophoropsis aurantiaca TaxID=72124 RepID=A0ACB8AGU3_9AGAM|nr:hypothetical protein BJ138DRAFT_1149167 [Hygrophoropsis aurantiaca]